jgi:hypothetical protein
VVIKPEREHYVEVAREVSDWTSNQFEDNKPQLNKPHLEEHYERDSQAAYSDEEEGPEDRTDYDDGYNESEGGDHHWHEDGGLDAHSVGEEQHSDPFASKLDQGNTNRRSIGFPHSHLRSNQIADNHSIRAQKGLNTYNGSDLLGKDHISRSMIAPKSKKAFQDLEHNGVRSSDVGPLLGTEDKRTYLSTQLRGPGDHTEDLKAPNPRETLPMKISDQRLTSSESQILKNQALLEMVNSYLKIPTGYRNPYNSVVYQKQIFSEGRAHFPLDKQFALDSYSSSCGENRPGEVGIRIPGVITHGAGSHHTSMLGLRDSLETSQRLQSRGNTQ